MFRKGLCEGLESLVPSRWEHGEGIQGGPLGDTGIPVARVLGSMPGLIIFPNPEAGLAPRV